MRIYLDTCCLQRPLDSKTQVRIILEAEAILGILSLCESGKAELISSEALLFETEHTPNLARQQFAVEVLSKAKIWVALDAALEKRAKELNTIGFKPLDALHLASAEAAQADYFCTCDDRLIKKAKATEGLTIKAVSPIEAISEVENDNRD